MDFYSLLFTQKLSGGGGGDDQNDALKFLVNRITTKVTAEMLEGVTSIGPGAFSHCSALTSIPIPSGVTSIGVGAFNGCSALTSVTIPSSVTSIGHSAFESCNALASITIPEGATYIGNYAFNYCYSLTSVTVRATTPPTLGYNAFGPTSGSAITPAIFYVPAASVETYKTAYNWSTYASKIQAIPS